MHHPALSSILYLTGAPEQELLGMVLLPLICACFYHVYHMKQRYCLIEAGLFGSVA